jgi:protein required for attachment to host cells
LRCQIALAAESRTKHHIPGNIRRLWRFAELILAAPAYNGYGKHRERVSMVQFKLVHKAWIFVGDGQKALFLINEGDEKFPNLRRLSVVENPDPPSREQGSDAPGRAYSSVGEIHSSVENTDWHELQKERFAASVAERINRAALSCEFSQIVIVAPAKILGDLRREFTKETESKIVAEIGKDLTNHTIAEIERLLMAH